jgi:hypothetical protein
VVKELNDVEEAIILSEALDDESREDSVGAGMIGVVRGSSELCVTDDGTVDRDDGTGDAKTEEGVVPVRYVVLIDDAVAAVKVLVDTMLEDADGVVDEAVDDEDGGDRSEEDDTEVVQVPKPGWHLAPQ